MLKSLLNCLIYINYFIIYNFTLIRNIYSIKIEFLIIFQGNTGLPGERGETGPRVIINI